MKSDSLSSRVKLCVYACSLEKALYVAASIIIFKKIEELTQLGLSNIRGMYHVA
jgi:hypothetical protein